MKMTDKARGALRAKGSAVARVLDPNGNVRVDLASAHRGLAACVGSAVGRLRSVVAATLLSLPLLALGGSWAAAEEIGAVSAPLGPMAKPALRVGDKAVWQNKKGEEWTRTVVAVGEDTATFEDSDGCVLTRPRDLFADLVEWKNCGSDGKGTVELTKGDAWPLKDGNKWRYKYTGASDTGRKYKYRTSCRVKKQIRVQVPAGEFDTYHVTCTAGRIKKHFYVSPETGTYVMYARKDTYGRQKAVSRKLVSFIPARSE